MADAIETWSFGLLPGLTGRRLTFEGMTFPASGVKMTDIYYSCNCMCRHYIENEDDTRPTEYEKRK